SAVPSHYSIGYDITSRVQMRSEEVQRRFRTPLLQPVLGFAEVWFRDHDVIGFHDPLAAVTVFRNDVCRFQTGTVDVELHDTTLRGRTAWQADERGRHQVAVSVDA